MMRAGILSFALSASSVHSGLALEGGALSLSYKDCGDSSYHSKITSLTPSVATIGRKTKITGTGNLDQDISDATFDMQVAFSSGVPLLDCSGDASVQKKCGFPLNTGSLTFAGVDFPIKAGLQDINIDLYLSPLLPSGFIKTTTKVTAVTSNGEQIFCINVLTGKSDQNVAVSLSYEDCGDAGTHAKITALTPSSVPTGRKTRITGKGMLDRDIAEGTFHAQTFFTGGDLLSCSGDAAQSKKCDIGGILGSLTFDALSFPVKKGDASVSVDMSLNPLIPAALAQTTTKVTASTKSGDKIFCMEVFTAPANAVTEIPPIVCKLVKNEGIEKKAVNAVCSKQKMVPAAECETELSKIWDFLAQKECSNEALTAIPPIMCKLMENEEVEKKMVDALCSKAKAVPAAECETVITKVWDLAKKECPSKDSQVIV